MKIRRRLVTSLILLGLAVLAPIMQGCAAATIEAAPQTMDHSAGASQPDSVPG